MAMYSTSTGVRPSHYVVAASRKTNHYAMLRTVAALSQLCRHVNCPHRRRQLSPEYGNDPASLAGHALHTVASV
jgi:hypothetical protein